MAIANWNALATLWQEGKHIQSIHDVNGALQLLVAKVTADAVTIASQETKIDAQAKAITDLQTRIKKLEEQKA